MTWGKRWWKPLEKAARHSSRRGVGRGPSLRCRARTTLERRTRFVGLKSRISLKLVSVCLPHCKMTKTVGKMISLIAVHQIPETSLALMRTRVERLLVGRSLSAVHGWRLGALGGESSPLSSSSPSLGKHPIGVPLLELPACLTARLLGRGVFAPFPGRNST